MTILFDPRTGSKDLALYIRPATLCAVAKRNIGADAAFSGRGPNGRRFSIGIEVKKVPDFLTCMADGRFSGHQLIEMYEQFDVRYMIVEGITRRNIESGRFEVLRDTWRGTEELPGVQTGWRWSAILGRQLSFSHLAGVWFLYTQKREETALVVKELWHWWNDKEFEEHRSHLQPHMLSGGHATLTLAKPSYTQIFLMGAPGIRDTWRDFAKAFGSIEGLCKASVEEIAAVRIGAKRGAKKRAFGKKAALAVWNALRGLED